MTGILLSLISHFSFFLLGSFGIGEGSVDFALDIATGTFSIVLFAITLYAWSRRSRQPTLLLVSFGFLSFFVKQTAEALPITSLHSELFGSVMDFLTLSLFFVALVVRPRRNMVKETDESRIH